MIEPNKVRAKEYSEILESSGWSVIQVESVPDAIEQLTVTSPSSAKPAIRAILVSDQLFKEPEDDRLQAERRILQKSLVQLVQTRHKVVLMNRTLIQRQAKKRLEVRIV